MNLNILEPSSFISTKVLIVVKMGEAVHDGSLRRLHDDKVLRGWCTRDSEDVGFRAGKCLTETTDGIGIEVLSSRTSIFHTVEVHQSLQSASCKLLSSELILIRTSHRMQAASLRCRLHNLLGKPGRTSQRSSSSIMRQHGPPFTACSSMRKA